MYICGRTMRADPAAGTARFFMDTRIFAIGDHGQEIRGTMRVVRNRGATRVCIGERYLDEIIADAELGDRDGVVDVGPVVVTWQTDE